MTHQVFGLRMREERQRAGLSQAALAERLSEPLGRRIDPSALARMEFGERVVRLDEAVAVAEVLALPLTSLLRDRDAIDEEIGELERDLVMARWHVSEAETKRRAAEDAVQSIRRRIAELEGSRDQ